MIKWKMARSTTYCIHTPLKAALSRQLPDSNLHTVYYCAIKLMRSANVTSFVIYI